MNKRNIFELIFLIFFFVGSAVLVLAGKRRAVSRDEKRASPGLRSVVHPGQKESAEPWPTDRPTVYLFFNPPPTGASGRARAGGCREGGVPLFFFFYESAPWGSVKRARREVDAGKKKYRYLFFFVLL